MLLLVFQFNSISKPIIILISIFLSFTGVFLGITLFQMPFVILMTMMGIISLSGIVVNNGVVLLDYTQLLIDRKKIAMELPEESMLPKAEAVEAIIEGGTARLRPVILTADYHHIGIDSFGHWSEHRLFLLVFGMGPQGLYRRGQCHFLGTLGQDGNLWIEFCDFPYPDHCTRHLSDHLPDQTEMAQAI
jgi:hypothetical protein